MILKFGKFKGFEIDRVPASYLLWGYREGVFFAQGGEILHAAITDELIHRGLLSILDAFFTYEECI
jgi:uncharacterized protein (DUF3820 family)